MKKRPFCSGCGKNEETRACEKVMSGEETLKLIDLLED
jgi:hypothetical protein